MATTPTRKTTEAPTLELITKREAARRLKVCERMVEIMTKEGRIPVVRIGRSVRYNWSAILDALSEASPTN